MDKKLKKALDRAFAAPPPAGKAAFLRSHRRRELGCAEGLLIQAGYVRWWTWAGSAALFAAMLVLAAGQEAERVWMVSSLTPLLALTALAEWGRSRRYGMEELELCCRMSLRSVLLARMTAVGLLHLVLLGLAAPALALRSGTGVLRAGVYLATPYLLSAGLGMELSRRIRGQEGLLACTAAGVLVCALGTWILNMKSGLYQAEFLLFWRLALCLALGGSGFELVRTLKETEELQWN